MSLDLTDRFHRFRAAARQLVPPVAADDVVALFRALVMFPLPPEAAAMSGSADGEVLDCYRVLPAAPQVSALISTDIPAAGAWDHPVTRLEAAAVDLRLIAVFDWDTAGPRDFQFLRVRIVHADDPGLVGRDALLDADTCRVEYAG